jgi:ABC-type polysaccharide/polyol phosphate export permease
MARIGRATIYMSGLLVMLIFLIVVGGLGFVDSTSSSLAIGILFVFLTLVNMTTIGPVMVARPIRAITGVLDTA